MSIKTVLFDLDGTLLPMDQDTFVGDYFSRLTKKMVPYGYDPKQLIKATWAGTAEMVKNNGKVTNEEAFWKKFAELYGEDKLADKPTFEDFYLVEFDEVKSVCGYNPDAAKAIGRIKQLGLGIALATNPLFPSPATYHRINWAGLNADDFEYITTYENSHYCKPNPKYYAEIAEKLGLDPAETLMVGNDADEDTAAEAVGMKVFLLTDCLINKSGKDIAQYPNGTFDKLIEYIEANA